jgi:tRNA threonylcarbamoyladenosine modification (KEOPS) complex  Pcc1 subunit
VTDDAAAWSATITVHLPDPNLAAWVERTLSPEAAREVPRTRATVRSAAPDRVEIAISARDTGAMRAALNTYLGWVHLSLATLSASTSGAAPAGPRE